MEVAGFTPNKIIRWIRLHLPATEGDIKFAEYFVENSRIVTKAELERVEHALKSGRVNRSRPREGASIRRERG
jgi:hypothetical protein